MLLVVEWLGLLLVVPGSVEAGSAASSAPGSDDPVDGSEPVVLQSPSRAETTISGGSRRNTARGS